MLIFILLLLGVGIFWSVAYLLIIRCSMLDQTYGMPLVAICVNISWEFIFSFIYPPHIIQHVINLIWFFLDVIILLQFLRYGPREFADLPKWVFYLGFGLALVTSFFAVLLIASEFQDGVIYVTFGQTLLMSILFVVMLYRRRSLRGQSVGIATCKLLGTGMASLAFFLFTRQSALLLFFYIAIFVYDATYLGMVVYMQQRAGVKATQISVGVSGEA